MVRSSVAKRAANWTRSISRPVSRSISRPRSMALLGGAQGQRRAADKLAAQASAVAEHLGRRYDLVDQPDRERLGGPTNRPVKMMSLARPDRPAGRAAGCRRHRE